MGRSSQLGRAFLLLDQATEIGQGLKKILRAMKGGSRPSRGLIFNAEFLTGSGPFSRHFTALAGPWGRKGHFYLDPKQLGWVVLPRSLLLKCSRSRLPLSAQTSNQL